MEAKTCNQCNKEKQLSEFYRRSDSPTLHRATCKRCMYSNELAKGKTPERKAYLAMKSREYRAQKR